MTSDFRLRWLEAVDKKNSVLCAGLDPAEYEVGRGEEGLAKGASKRKWALDYLMAVSPFCAAVKANIQFWKARGDMQTLQFIFEVADKEGLVVIDDSKLADIGSTNDVGMYHAEKRADAVTLAPFAGNLEEMAKDLNKRNLGGITMCLMSNPEYRTEKKKLVPTLGRTGEFGKQDIVRVGGFDYVPQYIYLANQASRLGLSGIVVGAPSEKNHITNEELATVKRYSINDMLVLLPGVGKQGGEAGKIWEHFSKESVIVNVGRALMFPYGSNTTKEQHAEAAKFFQNMLNEKRKVA